MDHSAHCMTWAEHKLREYRGYDEAAFYGPRVALYRKLCGWVTRMNG